jgi:signal transduction histidine kinase/ActR/RegA family two-component response regulator
MPATMTQPPTSAPRRRRLVTVQGKLVGLFTLVIGAISGFIYLYFPASFEREAIQALAHSAEGIGTMAAFNVRSAVLFEDQRSIEAALQGVLADEDVMYIEVFDNAGSILVSLRSDVVALTIPTRAMAASGLSPDRKAYQVMRAIRFDGREIGTIYLAMSTEAVLTKAQGLQQTVQIVSALVFCCGLLAVLIVSRLVTGPLRTMVGATERLAEGDLSVRAPISSTDEVGVLAKSFNRMVERVQAAQQKMKLVNIQQQQILDSIPAEVGVLDLDYRYLYVNPAAISDRREREWLIGKSPEDYWSKKGVDSGIGGRTRGAMRQCLERRGLVSVQETVPGAEGTERRLICYFSPMFGEDGTVTRLIHYYVDISDRHRAEQALRESEDQLRQAQKMEAIGRLAGGVAHDFNNLLTAISGYSELLSLNLDGNDPAHEDIEQIQQSVQRGAGLTRQLLTFSRKQVIQPKVLDLNAVVTGIDKMLRRLIGEDIGFTTQLDAAPECIVADPGQIEQVLVNLVVNARDAMPQGGSLTLRTANVDATSAKRERLEPTADGYVMLTVSDTGVGMDEATQARIFDPFFTTKGPAKGTGLGLSTVYGIVSQSQGNITVRSKPGAGTTFTVYLPLAQEGTEAADADCTEPVCIGGTETILVAEDENCLRELVQRVLERFGYKVLAASDPGIALSLVAGYEGKIDLLLTDVVMPVMSGPELAEKVKALRCETEVLYMSGYSDDALLGHRIVESGYTLLHKPFTPEALARQVRETLDAVRSRSDQDGGPPKSDRRSRVWRRDPVAH